MVGRSKCATGIATAIAVLFVFIPTSIAQARINRLFSFARNTEPFNSAVLDRDDYITAYLNIGIRPETICINDEMNLTAFTERASNVTAIIPMPPNKRCTWTAGSGRRLQLEILCER